MSIQSHYRNMQDLQVEQALENTAKKKDLLMKFQQRKKQKAEAPPTSVSTKNAYTDSSASSLEETAKYKELYRKMKKEKDALAKQLEAEKRQARTDKQKDQELTQQLQKAKTDRFHDQQEMARLNVELELARREVADLKERLSKTETASLQMDKVNQTMSRELRYSREAQRKRKVELANINRKIFFSKITSKKLNEKHNEAVKTIKTLQYKLREKDALLKQFKENDPSLLLATLHQALSLRSLPEFEGVVKLYNKYCLLNNHKQLKEVAKEENQPDFIYGTVEVFTDKTIGFTDLDGIRYTVMNPPLYLKSGDPVSAELIGKFQVEIQQVYQFESKLERKSTILHTKKKNPLKKKGRENPLINTKLGQGVRVLVLTSTNGVKYRDYLNMYGFNATWHDAYEKSPQHTHTMMDKFDIVLLFWDSNPHLTLGFIPDKEDKKYVFVQTQEEDRVLYRTYFTARELGLIE